MEPLDLSSEPLLVMTIHLQVSDAPPWLIATLLLDSLTSRQPSQSFLSAPLPVTAEIKGYEFGFPLSHRVLSKLKCKRIKYF